jgi:anti-sigma factor RsiW
MNCAEFESKLADYVDGSLTATGRAEVESHAANCAGCREFMAEVSGMAALLERVEDVEPPAELITRIAFQAPQGRSRDAADVFGFWPELKAKWIQPWLDPLLQPRFAMGMAMTVLSFSMLEKCGGVKVQHLQAADLNPAHVLATLEDRAVRTKDRLVKNYENLRVVYEIESRLNDAEQKNSSIEPVKQDQNKQQPDKQGEKK